MADRREAANDTMPDTASKWLLALAERPDDRALRAAFERWRGASADNARDWAEINRAASLLATSVPPSEPGWAKFLRQRRAAEAGRQRRHRRIAGGLAALAAAACLLLFFQGSTLLLRFEADYMTASAEQRRLDLADGTNVVLAPQSAIVADYSSAERRVKLLKGAAFFEVANDARPFAVAARGVVARDVGTAFEVRLGAAAVEVAVRDGIVDVTAANVAGTERLLAGQWAQVTQTGAVGRGQAPRDLVAAWTAGQLVVKNQPVSDVIDALRPYFEGVVVLHGRKLAAEPLTGIYNLADPVGALRAVARAQGASLHQISPWLIVVTGD
ncbi:FecR family protein [Reyranella sp.]|uniref:FecR family protein n=1 Tax=Reyranella sp. TaxID=1929291 RepID=UPI003D14A5D1